MLDSSCWAECKKAKVGDCRWSWDNIRWPLRASEIRLYGATLLLLSCLDTFLFFLSLSFSFLPHSFFLFFMSAELSFGELAACIWSWGNLLAAIRKWCAKSCDIVLSDKAIWSPQRANWRKVFVTDGKGNPWGCYCCTNVTNCEWANNYI